MIWTPPVPTASVVPDWKSMNVTTTVIDLAKDTFSVHGVDSHDKVMSRKRLNRAKACRFWPSNRRA